MGRGRGCLLGVVALAGLALIAVAAFTVLPADVTHSFGLSPSMTRFATGIDTSVSETAKSLLPLGERVAHEVGKRVTYPHIALSAGRDVKPKTQSFQFDGVTYSITPHVASDVYWGAKRSTRLMVQLPTESDASWTDAYYHAFADDPAQTPALDDVATQLRAIKRRAGLSSDQYLELIAKYVQSIPYDWDLYASGAGKQRFPVEVLVEDKGLCGDKSVLLAKLLSHEGYAAALLDFGREKHMAVGVKGEGQTYGDSGWLFVETTAPCYVTDVPTAYAGGMTLQSEPVVVPIGSGTLRYGAADQISRILAVRSSAKEAADGLYQKAKGESLTRDEARAINVKLRQAYRAQTSLRSNVVDRNGKSVGAFLDRVAALHWIDRNVWWL